MYAVEFQSSIREDGSIIVPKKMNMKKISPVFPLLKNIHV